MGIGLIRFLPRYRNSRELLSLLHSSWRELLLCVIIANIPDLDYFFGIFRNNLNYYHQTVTHTVVWITASALILWAFARLRDGRKTPWTFLLFMALLSSHLFVDLLTADYSPPVGLTLVWPFSSRCHHSVISVLPACSKDAPCDILSLHNLRAALAETAFTLPLAALALWLKRKTGSSSLIVKRS